MKRAALFLIICLSAFMVSAQSKDDILGKWINPSGEGQIEIYKRGDKYFGKLVWLKEPNDETGKPKKDVKNPKENLRNQSVLGLEILKDFSYENNKWTGGEIYDPKSGKTYSCNMTLKDHNTLNIRGYIGVSLLGRTESWKRVK
ncbi:DUF2147 domain-containing protein [Pedobacter montanisoli]|uniref:DUF2147 domain-containing protein n=1 Tax=Pedobacter montanisoli TaxID=2923277 RepID=A0ABS9ZXA3_9SPHI|nr:DUF2147 domain-containing protein [Pedobacter montanisoli]MCJ0742956.1 DUF2147 domain-containing protein [Pedobacter montanisoli]